MKPDEILQYCLETLEGTILVSSWGERGVFYNPGGKLKRGVYVLTVKERDGENDRSSQSGPAAGDLPPPLRPSAPAPAQGRHCRHAL